MSLLLLDIDGTLVDTRGAGLIAMNAAARDVFDLNDPFTGIDMGGRLDPLILADAMAPHGVDHQSEIEHFRACYTDHLARLLADGHPHAALPGVLPMLDALAGMEHVTLAVLTGNFASSGELKLRACGIDPERFHLHCWGDHAPSRPDLVAVALQRYAELGHQPEPARTFVLGDTVHDVTCAKAHDCVALGVATGRASKAQLETIGADLVLDDLTDVSAIYALLDA